MRIWSRFAMGCSLSWAIFVVYPAFAQTTVTIEVNDSATGQDDYFCWAPVRARVRATTGDTNPVAIVLESSSANGGGGSGFCSLDRNSPDERYLFTNL
jgi:hypothetical protein